MSMLLPLLILMPMLGGLILLFARRGSLSDAVGENVATLIALGSLALSVLLVISVARLPQPDAAIAASAAAAIEPGAPPMDAHATAVPTILPKIEFAPDWFRIHIPANATLGNNGWQMRLGLDGIGAIMVLLTTLVTSCVLVIARTTVDKNRSDFSAWLLMASGCMLLVFMSMDLMLFYIGFELVLIPLFVLISGWGDRDATIAAKRFVLYTLAGSIPMVIALLGIAMIYSPGDKVWEIGFSELSLHAATDAAKPELAYKQAWIFWLLVLGLGIKTAVLPLHTWLPTTYGAAHPTCSAFLAAVVLKLGLFGFLRLVLPLVPLAVADSGTIVLGTLGAVAIVYGALAALAQRDLRLLMAYSSLSHVGFITLGMFALNEEGLAGSTLQMFNHGLTTAAMFLLMACMVVRRGSTRWDEGSRGIANNYPRLAFFLVFFVIAGAGTPGLNNFVGELLALTAMISVYPILTAIGVLGVVLGAWYALRMTQHVLFGKYDPGKRMEYPGQLQSSDLGFDQKAVFAPLALLSIAIGVVPLSAIDIFRSDVQRIAQVSAMARKSMSEPLSSDTPPLAESLPVNAAELTSTLADAGAIVSEKNDR